MGNRIKIAQRLARQAIWRFYAIPPIKPCCFGDVFKGKLEIRRLGRPMNYHEKGVDSKFLQ
jgi:hypothetical protein